MIGYLEAITRLLRRNRGKLLPIEKIKERLDICYPCPHFTGDFCDLCECCTNQERTFFNKLAFPTERCPDNPPRWLEIE